MKKKKIIPIIALIVLVIAIIGMVLQPNFIQIGDYVASDTYYDTAYEAYKKTDDRLNIKEEIITIDINSEFALWFAASEDNELALVKMAVQNGKYFSLGDVSIYSENTLKQNIASLDDGFSLGNDTLRYIILPEAKYKQSSLEKENYNTEYFEFIGDSYVFVYEVVTD